MPVKVQFGFVLGNQGSLGILGTRSFFSVTPEITVCLVTCQSTCFAELAGFSCHPALFLHNIVIVETSSAGLITITSVSWGRKSCFVLTSELFGSRLSEARLKPSRPFPGFATPGTLRGLGPVQQCCWTLTMCWVRIVPGAQGHVLEAFPTSGQVNSHNLLAHVRQRA